MLKKKELVFKIFKQYKVEFKRLRTPIEKNCDKSGKQNLLITQQISLPKQLKIAFLARAGCTQRQIVYSKNIVTFF